MIYLKKRAFQEIIAHCQGEYSKEACGILAGRPGPWIKCTGPDDRCEPVGAREQEGKLSKIYKMVNTSEAPGICYFMDPKEQLKVFKEMRQSGIEMMGIYLHL